MELGEAIRLLKAVAPNLVFERPHAEAFRVVLGEAERLAAEFARLRDACARDDHEVGRVLGRALGYPRYADDPASFPGATDADGVCTGDHVAVTLAAEAAERIGRLTAERDAAIRRQIRYGGDAAGRDEWWIESWGDSFGGKAGPHWSEGSAFASVLAWVRHDVDPANSPAGPTEGEADE